MGFLVLLAVAANPPELGKVKWERDFDAAVRRSKETQKPLLVLFDEVPGCSTVLGFGESVLSDADVVARIERDFVPVAVFNNIGGADAKVLASFGEPTWNNPVVRVMDANRRELTARFEGPYTKDAFAKVLDAVKPKLETLTLGAACFWECEAKLGTLDAVRASRVGFLEGAEVVEVQFDPSVTPRAKFLEEAKRLDCAPKVYANGVMRYSEKDTKYFVKGSARSTPGLSEQDLVRLNSKLSR
ncbi:MAG: thioredoxin family protein [Archangium sp.]